MNEIDSPFRGIQNLLNLHNYTGEVGGGYWVSIKAFEIPPHDGQPHGISYTLTLHSPGDGRLIGYDNAHVPPMFSGPSKRSRRRLLCWDHRHWRDTVYVYNFVSAERLLEDFWTDVEKMLEEEGQP